MENDLTCAACDEIISKGYVIIGGAEYSLDSDRVVLHAGSLTEGGGEEVTSLAMREPDGCIAQYLSSDPERQIYHPVVVSFDDERVERGTEGAV